MLKKNSETTRRGGKLKIKYLSTVKFCLPLALYIMTNKFRNYY